MPATLCISESKRIVGWAALIRHSVIPCKMPIRPRRGMIGERLRAVAALGKSPVADALRFRKELSSKKSSQNPIITLINNAEMEQINYGQTISPASIADFSVSDYWSLCAGTRRGQK